MNKLLPFFIFFCLTHLHAQHTFSIVAVDPETGEVGTAGATCLTSEDCGGCGGAVIISQIFPGLGALNAQAQVCIPNTNGINGMRKMINDGFNAEEALEWLLQNDACQFGGVDDRQYGIAMLQEDNTPNTAAFTGNTTLSYANHIIGPNYTIQGNILIGSEVLEGMEAGFLGSDGNLAEKLMAAMQGANIPGADSRCLVDGISSKSAFIKVAQEDDAGNQLYLDLNVPRTANLAEPIDSLQTLFDAWFLTNSNQEVLFDSNILLFPNPARDKVQIKLEDIFLNANCEIQFYNEMGKLVYEQNLENNITVVELYEDVFASGLYIYKVHSDQQLLKTGKLIIYK